MDNTRVQDWKAFVEQIKLVRPLVHHITNNVTMNFLANGVLAAGGSPMMVHDEREVEDAVAAADALVLNIGTLEESTAKSMKLALRKAMHCGVPVVIDPVGVGLSSFRQETIKELLSEYSKLKGVSPQTILTICGNAAEMKFLAGLGWEGRGADGDLGSSESESHQLAIAAANQTGCIIAMTGEKDVVTDGESVIELSHGHPLLSLVTGTGCFATSMIGLYQANQKGGGEQDLPLLERTALALLMLTKAAEVAVDASRGPGSFQTNLIDELFLLERTESIWKGKTNWIESTAAIERGAHT
jgi:hydroxyethylthiazole kinase